MLPASRAATWPTLGPTQSPLSLALGVEQTLTGLRCGGNSSQSWQRTTASPKRYPNSGSIWRSNALHSSSALGPPSSNQRTLTILEAGSARTTKPTRGCSRSPTAAPPPPPPASAAPAPPPLPAPPREPADGVDGEVARKGPTTEAPSSRLRWHTSSEGKKLKASGLQSCSSLAGTLTESASSCHRTSTKVSTLHTSARLPSKRSRSPRAQREEHSASPSKKSNLSSGHPSERGGCSDDVPRRSGTCANHSTRAVPTQTSSITASAFWAAFVPSPFASDPAEIRVASPVSHSTSKLPERNSCKLTETANPGKKSL
mmetsp:Transcript_129631/g.327278  ORF Transcript_129631/g.327278 Transcript_129631/m.327278 type:complete len:315 (+) Transcript_129631:190-1134(+)